MIRPLIWPLEKCSTNDWEEREQFWIAFFRQLPGLLNSTIGGDRGFAGGRHSEETKAKFRQMRKGKRPSLLNIQKTIERNRRGLSSEVRLKISKTLTGKPTGRRPHPNFIAATIARNKKGLSQEARARVAAKLRGRKLSPEHILKVQNSEGWRLAQIALKSCNERRKKPIECIETGQIFACLKDAAAHAKVSTHHLRNNIKGGWRTRGYHYKQAEVEQ